MNEATVKVDRAKFPSFAKAFMNNYIDKATDRKIFKVLTAAGKTIRLEKDPNSRKGYRVVIEKAVSQQQQKFMGMVRAYQKGEMPDASPEVKKAAQSMSKKDVKDFASTKHKGLPVKKESVVHEDVNMKNVDKLKAAARDFGKNKDINFKSIEDALLTIVQSMRVLDKSTSGRTDVKHERIISKQETRINNIINKTMYGKGGATEEGREIKKIMSKHGLDGLLNKVIYEGVEMNEKTNWKMGDGRPRNGARIQNDRFWNLPRASLEYIRKDAHAAMKANPNGKKAGKYADEVNDAETVLAWRKKNGIRESVEMNEEFVVKYAKNKRGPIYQTKFKSQGEAEKFLAQKRKEGMNGIVSKAGKPVSMQKMKDLQKESVNEAINYMKVSKELDDYAKKHGGIDKVEFQKAAAYVREIGRNSALSVQDKAGKGLNMLFKNADTDVRDRLQMILTKGGFKVKGGYVMRESVDLSENYRTLARAGMGTESKGEARVGLELDYYDGAGTKRMGKITKVTPKGYMVKDDKDGKVRQFTFHDRAKAKEILARIGKGKYNESLEEKSKFKSQKSASQNKSFKSLRKRLEDSDPCWDSHKQIGMKKKGGKMVPNCVPK